MTSATAVLLDLDGTLIDSNYQHALAWYRALLRYEIVVPVWRVHRHIGMGGDQFVTAVAGERIERELGDDLREAAALEFRPLRAECAPLAGARELVLELKRRNLTVVLASSSGGDDLDYFLGQLELREVVDDWTTKDDVDRRFASSRAAGRNRSCVITARPRSTSRSGTCNGRSITCRTESCERQAPSGQDDPHAVGQRQINRRPGPRRRDAAILKPAPPGRATR